MQMDTNSTENLTLSLNTACEQIFRDATSSLVDNGIIKFCRAVHDGVMCWPPALPGTTVYLACPASFEGEGYNQNCKF
ncbi:unnamed protein product [Hymenolepis diminuta]|uniref:G-protein coupled receptors family 2 profile 1 domain-containing protein n=1 Tax=Hymenolepis diminuta TaxID=6216 RepID=A0A564XZP2_HYMDI|nr:unnamed protein product [Hymenolepis diminuta]